MATEPIAPVFGDDVTMATIRIRPQDEPRVMALAAEAEQLRNYALGLRIQEDSDLQPVTVTLNIMATAKKALNAAKADYLKPIRGHLDDVNAAFTTIMGPLDEADKITRHKVLEYRQAVAKRQAEEEEINRLRQEAARKEMDLKGELTEPVGLMEVTPLVRSTVRTDFGSAGVMKIRKYRIVDFALLPDQYKIENIGLLTRVVKAGIAEIPGVEIFEVDTLAVRPRS